MSTAEPTMASLFSALGDDVRLSVVCTLGAQGAQSATSLARDASVSRQAIVQHLQVLERAGVVSRGRQGREVLFALEPERLGAAQAFIQQVSATWDRRIDRLRALVDEG